jgi:hypothetical protein
MLWSHAAQQVVTACVASGQRFETVSAGIGCGLRNPADRRRGLLVHPAGEGRDIGDLAITVLGYGTHVVPRCGQDFGHYVDAGADIVEITAESCLAD